MNAMNLVLVALVLCLLLQGFAWWRQKVNRNADTVDIAWTFGIVVCGLVYLMNVPAGWQQRLLVMLFPVLWYLRLLWHLCSRYDVQHEDGRYQNLRAHWSNNTQVKFFAFFMFQALLSVLFSLPALWVLQAEVLATWQIIVALLIGIVALVGVTLADYQLLKFKRNHDSTQVCDIGLWRYSRHPNYFFEWLHWFVYPVLLWHSSYFAWSLMIVAS